MRIYRIITIIAFLFCAVGQMIGHAAADRTRLFQTPRHRLDLRDLGYHLVNEIPSHNSAITSLLTATSGIVYGGTSGDEGYLFLYNPGTNKARHLGKTPDSGSIHHALAEGADGAIYFGTGKNMLQPLTLTPGRAGDGYIDQLLWQDIQNHFRDYPGGRLYRYDPDQSNRRVKLPEMTCDAKDLGIPVPGNSIYVLTASPEGDEIYGLTYPDGRFFVYNVQTGKFKDIGPVDEEIVFHGPERDWRSLPRALLCDDMGRVFTSGTKGNIIYYSRQSGQLHTTNIRIPGDYNYSQMYWDHAVIECMAQAPSGLIYGGTCDGYLFSLDPTTMELRNLGKARAARRLRCLTIAADEKVYFMAGERSVAVPCQPYLYDPQLRGFQELGFISVDRSPYYKVRGVQFDCMTTGQDGTIYIGESEFRGRLFLLFPE